MSNITISIRRTAFACAVLTFCTHNTVHGMDDEKSTMKIIKDIQKSPTPPSSPVPPLRRKKHSPRSLSTSPSQSPRPLASSPSASPLLRRAVGTNSPRKGSPRQTGSYSSSPRRKNSSRNTTPRTSFTQSPRGKKADEILKSESASLLTLGSSSDGYLKTSEHYKTVLSVLGNIHATYAETQSFRPPPRYDLRILYLVVTANNTMIDKLNEHFKIKEMIEVDPSEVPSFYVSPRETNAKEQGKVYKESPRTLLRRHPERKAYKLVLPAEMDVTALKTIYSMAPSCFATRFSGRRRSSLTIDVHDLYLLPSKDYPHIWNFIFETYNVADMKSTYQSISYNTKTEELGVLFDENPGTTACRDAIQSKRPIDWKNQEALIQLYHTITDSEPSPASPFPSPHRTNNVNNDDDDEESETTKIASICSQLRDTPRETHG